MKLSTLAAAIAGAIVAGAATSYYYSQSGSAAAGSSEAVVLQFDQGVAGELTSKSYPNYSNGVRSALFSVQAEKNQIINLTVTGALRAQISVHHNGQMVIQSNDGRGGCGGCGGYDRENATETTLSFRAEEAGNYDIAVSGIDARAYGPFRLTASAIKPYSGEALKTDQSVTDWATGKELEYNLSIESDGIYTIDMRANPNERLDPYLTLLDANGVELISDDDSGGSLNARVQTLLKAGEYKIKAGSGDGLQNFQGGFTLQIRSLPIPEENRLQPGEALTLNAPAASNGLYTGERQNYTLQVDNPALVSIDLNTQGFYAELGLSKDGQTQATSPGYDSHQRIRSILQPGTYSVTLSGSKQSGLFTLSASSQPVPDNAGGGSLAVDEERQAVLLEGLDKDVYTIDIPRSGRYVIDMSSPSIDSYLTLRRNGRTVAEDDDSGGDLNARIETNLEAGQYTIEASSLGGSSRSQDYTISVRRN